MSTTIKAALLGLSTLVTAGVFSMTMAGVNTGLTKVERARGDSKNASAHYTQDGEEIVVTVARL